MNTNKKTHKALLAAILAAFVAATALMAGCGSGGSDATADEAKKETRVVTETQIVTKVVDGVYVDEDGKIIKDDNGQPMTAPSGTPDTDSNSGSGSGSNGGSSSNGGSGSNSSSANSSSADNGDNSGNGGNGSSNSGGNSGNSGSGSNSSGNNGSGGNNGGNAGTSALSIGGKSYNVGDTVTCTYTLTSKKLLSNFQAYIQYDGKYLKATNAYLDGPAKAGSVINYELYEKSQIKFNGINLNGYNYTKGDKFLVVEYEVVGGGSTAPEFVWQIACDTKDNMLVKNGTPDAAITLTEAYS